MRSSEDLNSPNLEFEEFISISNFILCKLFYGFGTIKRNSIGCIKSVFIEAKSNLQKAVQCACTQS